MARVFVPSVLGDPWGGVAGCGSGGGCVWVSGWGLGLGSSFPLELSEIALLGRVALGMMVSLLLRGRLQFCILLNAHYPVIITVFDTEEKQLCPGVKQSSASLPGS